MKLKGLTKRPKAVQDAAVEPGMTLTLPKKAVEPGMTLTLPKKKPERKMEVFVAEEDFPEMRSIPTVMSFRSTDSMDEMDRGLRYAPTDKSLDKYWGSVEGLGLTSSDSTGEPVWTHPASSEDDDRDWYPEQNSFDHYEERIAAARKKMNKDIIILPPSSRGTWSESDTLQTSPSDDRSTKENEGRPVVTMDEMSSSTSPVSPLNKKQKQKSPSTPALLKAVLKKRSPVEVETTSPPSSLNRQPSTKNTVAESKVTIQPDSPKAHSSAKVLAAGSAAAVVAGSQAVTTISPTSTSTKSKSSSSTQPTTSTGAANQSPTSISMKSKAEETVSSKNTFQWKEKESKNPVEIATPRKEASPTSTSTKSKVSSATQQHANQSPTSILMKSKEEETVSSKNTSQSKEKASKNPVEIATPRKEAVVVVPPQSSTKSNAGKKDHSTGIMGRARLFSLRRKPRSSQKATSSVSSKDSHEVDSTPTLNDPMASAPTLVKKPTSDNRAAGFATATLPSAAVTNPQAKRSPSKEKALQKALNKDGGSPGAPVDSSSGLPSAITPSNAITSKNAETASNLSPASAVDFSASALSPISRTAWSTAATTSKNSDTTSNLPPAASAVASLAAVAGLMNCEGKTKSDANDAAISEEAQTREEAGEVKEAAKSGSFEMKNITDRMISIGAAKVKSEARKEANQKNVAKAKSDALNTGSVENKEQVESEAKKKDSHETHRNMRFWKKRAEVNKTGHFHPEGATSLIQSEGAIEVLAEDSKFLKTIPDINSTDNVVPKAAPAHGSSTGVTPPTVEASIFKGDAAEAFLQQIQCGCLKDCIVNNKDAKWDGATSRAVAFGKLELDDEMDIDQAVAAMRRSRRNEPIPIKFIEFPKDSIMTENSSVTDSQEAVFEPKSMSESWTRSNDSGTLHNGRAKSFLHKLGKSSRRRTENKYH